MTTSKDKVVTSISKAKADLEQALADLEHLPSFDSGTIAFAAHALSNFLAVINGTTELLLLSLKDYDEVRVRNSLEGLRHAAGLMIHTVNQLMNTSAQSNPRLIHDNVNLALLVKRACQYYEGIAARKRIGIVFSSTEVPNAWTDRVAGQRSWTTCFQMPSSTRCQGHESWLRWGTSLLASSAEFKTKDRE